MGPPRSLKTRTKRGGTHTPHTQAASPLTHSPPGLPFARPHPASCSSVSCSLVVGSSAATPSSPPGYYAYGARPPPAMRTPRSRAMCIGFTIMLLSVSTGIHFGGGSLGLLLAFMGVLAGANLVAIGVCMADHPAPTFPAVFGCASAIAAFVRHSSAAVGFFMASCAFTVVPGEADPMLCFGMFVLLLLGLTLINVGARGE